ncbi:hypothetical protein M378DRAFT_92151, partial [Amanita muscaria Koide BX008]
FYTIPLGPQLQALWRTAEGAYQMEYRSRKTYEVFQQLARNGGVPDAYEDIFDGMEYLDTVRAGNITEYDTIVAFSLDGTQLYCNQESDCWFFMWMVFNLSPDLRYKKRYILPAGFVPGPNKPKVVETFLLPSFRHLSALQRSSAKVYHGCNGAGQLRNRVVARYD